MDIIKAWDKGTKNVRKKMLEDFIAQNQNKTGPELEQLFGQAGTGSLFLTRLTAWLRLTYMTGTCISELLHAIKIFLTASSGQKFVTEFMETGGILTLLEVICLKQANETDKAEALKCLYLIAHSGRKYKELICESYGIRVVAECLAKSQKEDTQDNCKNILLLLAQGNPKFQNQVYKGLIALLPCSSPKAQQLACGLLRRVQPMVGSANSAIIDPLLNLLRTFHLEIQFEEFQFLSQLLQQQTTRKVIELLKVLLDYEVADSILVGLVSLLKPALEDTIVSVEVHEGMKSSLPVFVQQAAAAKSIGILARESKKVAEKLVQLRVIHYLMYSMGNIQYADSQRQASITLEHFCRTFSIVDDHVRDAMGDTLYELFMSNPETLYLNMTHIQADILVSNKINLP